MPERVVTAATQPRFDFLELTPFEVTTSPHFADWLNDRQASLAFTNSDRHFLIGLKPDGRLDVSSAAFPRCMGLTRDGTNTLFLVTAFQIWRLENALPPGQLYEAGCDAVYLPQSAYTTGHLGVPDLAIDGDGQIVFANSLFSCLATVSDRYNFVPLWLPSFLPDLAPADYCHLSGLAMRNGRPAYVTSAGRGDGTEHGWRQHKRAGGVITDVETNQAVLSGLSMPFSPRFYRDSLWLTNAGTGQFGRVDLQRGQFEPLSFAPGFLRGLDFSGSYAVVGSSKSPDGELFGGLPLEDSMRQKRLEPWHGLYVVDLDTGEIVHWLQLDGVAAEIHAVVVLPNVRRPMAVEADGDQIQAMVTVGSPDSLNTANSTHSSEEKSSGIIQR